MLVFVLIVLLIASILGVLGAVLKAALVIILAIVLAFAIMVAGTFWYLRFRLNRFVRDMDHRHRGYPTRGHKAPDPDPRLPPD
jgi:hypothetical protein